MALVKSVLKKNIKDALLSEMGGNATKDQKDSAEELASKLSSAIDSYIKSATIMSTGANSGGPVVSTSTSIL
jgi:hypothetical protein